MKHLSRWTNRLLIATVVFFTLANVAEVHAGGKPKKPKPIYNAIASVDTTAMTITTETKNSTATATKTYKYSPKTTVTINGQTGTVAGLTSGMRISVGLGMDGTTAESLSATNPPADPNEKK